MKVDPLRFVFLAVVSLGISLLACRPVFTVGWGEILILIGILALIVGPLVIRFLRSRAGTENGDPSASDDQNSD